MEKNDMLIVLGTPHRLREPGKTSPDGRLRECVYGREIVARVARSLRMQGYQVEVDYEPLDLPKDMQSENCKTERSRELAMRVAKVNGLCSRKGARNVMYVSIHVNASGNDGQWHQPHGWQVHVGTKTSARSKMLAGCLLDAARECGLTTRQPAPGQKYWQQNLMVLNETACPAVLTENLFQDNEDDVAFLLSDEGKQVIERLHVEGIVKYIGEQ